MKRLFLFTLLLLGVFSFSALTVAWLRKTVVATLAPAWQLTAPPLQDPLTAAVIYRPPVAWDSTFWINKGSRDDSRILPNTPVLKEGAVIGLIEEVLAHQSRVRLITDPGLTPSVRVARGDPHRRELLREIDQVIALLRTTDEEENLRQQLATYRDQHQEELVTWTLAKGELCGTCHVAWRTREPRLRGIGFNYDFPDDEGPARDLRTGKPIGATGPAVPLIRPHDLLITTGFDGIFPAGLPIAIVTRVLSLQEGDYYFEIEARPAAGDLQEISIVTILPTGERAQFP